MPKERIALLSLLVLTGFGGALTMTPSPSEPSPRGSVTVWAAAESERFIVYVANEGIVVNTPLQKKVVIDGMFRHLPGYPRPSEAVRNQMENALGPFAGVDLVLATHSHADHFDPKVVGWHLSANPTATFVAGRQVTEALAKNFQSAGQFASRVLEVTPDFGQRKDLRVVDIDLSVLRLRHGSTMNTGYLLDLGVFKILHVGDADGEVSNFDPYDLQKEGINIALVPYWYALDEESRRVIREHIAPKQVIFFHIPEDNPDDDYLRKHMQEVGGRAGLVARIKKDFPQALFLLTPDAPAASYSR
jgi:L-ascorbate metabolism protein UlaG (beta-lactamase superfamily)